MSKIKKLFKFQLDNKYDLFKHRSAKTVFMSVFKHLIAIIGITLGLWLFVKEIFFYLSIKVNAQFIAIALVITQAIIFVFAIATVIKTLYLSKDNQLLIVLPVTFNQLFISKILILYVSELLFSLLYILPVFLTLGFIGSFGIYYYLMLFLTLPILPLLPIAFASIISIPIMMIVKYLKKHSILSIVVILIAVSLLFVLYMSFVSKLSGAFNVAEKQIETSIKINAKILKIGNGIFAYLQLAKSLISYKYIYYPVIFMAVGLLLVIGCFMIIKPFYYKIATITIEDSSSQMGKYKKFKKRKPFNELLLNEMRTIFRSPSYIFQYFLFPILMPLIVFVYDKLLMTIAVNQTGEAMIYGSHVLVLCIVALMSNAISSAALSREGNCLYLSKSSPISYYTRVGAKIVFNAIFTLGAIFITILSSLIFTKLSSFIVIITGISAMFLAVGHICHSFDLDLQNPVLDWYDNNEISTLSKNTAKSIAYALVLAVIMCFIIVFMPKFGVYVTLIFSILYCWSRIRMLLIRTKHYYNKMEL